LNFSLLAMPTLDVDSIDEETLDQLSAGYKKLGHLDLKPFSKIAEDTVRAGIDTLIAESFALPDLTPLRLALGQEPSITNISLVPDEGGMYEERPQLELVF